VFGRLLDRLTYANVVATIALFAALGGSAYAVATIGSADVKDRSLRGKDLRKNTVKGKQVKESSLRRVPRAAAAVTATSAQNAQLAQNAVNAENANLAARATDSDAVGGLGAGALEKSSRTQFGRRAASPPPSSEPIAFDWPEAGFRISIPAQGGCATSTHLTLRFANTRATGTPDLQVITGDGSVQSLSPGGNSVSCSGTAGRWGGAVVVPDDARTLFFDCRRLGDEVRCLGTRSEP
jgi:hypothetical protein